MTQRPKARTTARPLAVVVLAAGESKRFKSDTPKVLHDLCGRPLLGWVLDAIAPLKPARTVVVVGRAAEAVEAAATRLTKTTPQFARQLKLLGTADAARTADEVLGDHDGDVLIVSGDTPLLTTATLRALLKHHLKTGAKATVLSATLADPTGYGRVVRSSDGALEKIVEHADASDWQRQISEINAGVYVFDRTALHASLDKVGARNKQKEFYLPDVLSILREVGEPIEARMSADADEIRGVNDRAQLAEAATLIRAATNARLMADGVTLTDPTFTTIDPTVRVGRDTIIHAPTFLHGSTVIGARCQIGPGARIIDSTVGDDATVVFSTLDQAVVGPEASVGPYAYLRPGARLKRKAKVGTFVEVKNSTIGEGSKVPHLSYVGDADVGKDVNVGAATVTVNYDNETKIKARTVIGDGARIGSDTMLIAPVKVGKRALTGAGSVVTHDVAPDTLVYGNPARPARLRKRTTGKPTTDNKGGSK